MSDDDGKLETAPATTKNLEKDGDTRQGSTGHDNDVSDSPEQILQRAREFLASPAVRDQDNTAKRQFLLGKGVSSEVIDELMKEVASVPPPIPPRTYLAPAPPSTLPALVASLARAIGVLSAASGAGLWIYQGFIYPRLSDSFAARHSLRMSQLKLAEILTVRLEGIASKGKALRAAIEITSSVPLDADAEELTVDAEGPVLDEAVLTNSADLDYDALPSALTKLSETFSPTANPSISSAQQSLSTTSARTLQALTDLSAFLTSQTYTMPAASYFRLPSAAGANSRALGPAEEEVRREMRAIKGLVLNRRSFAAATSPVA